MSSPFVAEIRIFACNFAPTGWSMCNGQLMPISQITALFSLLGTFYGGDGKSTFALPNLQDSVPIGQGQGSGLSDRFLGESSGSPSVTLLQTETPVHSHNVGVQALSNGNTAIPSPAVVISKVPAGGTPFQSNTTSNIVQMNFQAIGISGSSFPHNNLQPFLGLNFCIALQGVFPPRT